MALRGWYSARVYVCTLETCIARDRVLAATVVGVNLRRRIVRASHCYGTTRITEPTTSRAPRRIRRAGGVVVACIDLGPKAASACLTTAQVCEGQAREWVGRAGDAASEGIVTICSGRGLWGYRATLPSQLRITNCCGTDGFGRWEP